MLLVRDRKYCKNKIFKKQKKNKNVNADKRIIADSLEFHLRCHNTVNSMRIRVIEQSTKKVLTILVVNFGDIDIFAYRSLFILFFVQEKLFQLLSHVARFYNSLVHKTRGD